MKLREVSRCAFSLILISTLLAPGVVEAQDAATSGEPEPADAGRQSEESKPASEVQKRQPSSVPGLPSADGDALLEAQARPSKVLTTWSEGLGLVETGSTNLVSARARIELARGQAVQALAGAMPRLVAAGSFEHALIRGEGFSVIGGGQPMELPIEPTTLVGSLKATVPVVKMRTWYDAKSRRLSAEAEEYRSEDAERLAIGALADSIAAVVTAERLAEVARINLRSAYDTLELTSGRAVFGNASGVDVLRAEQDVHRTRDTVLAADETVRKAREALGMALGTHEAWGVKQGIRLDGILDALAEVCQTAKSPDDRADIHAAEVDLHVAERDSKAYKRSWAPTLELSSTASIYSSPLISPIQDDVTWTVNALLSWTIYDGGLRAGERRAGAAQQAISEQSLEQTQRNARLEVVQAERAVDVARSRLDTNVARRDAARRTAELAQTSYLQGTGTGFDLVETQRSLREIEIDVTVSEYELLSARIAAVVSTSSCGL